MDVHFETTGCRLNQIESESAARLFTDLSFSVSFTPLTAKSPVDEECRVCIINTCAVTQKAEQKDRRIIRLVLEKCPNATVVVTGCYAQLSKEKINAMDERVACLPGLIKNRIKEVSLELTKRNNSDFSAKEFSSFLRDTIFSRPMNAPSHSEDAFELSTDTFLNHSRASIKIQDGCNCACSYCTIHTARGKSVSLAADRIIERIQALENSGMSEVVFTAVNIGQYRGLYNGDLIDFPHLLKLCLKNTKNIAFRISSLYPETVDDYFLEVIKSPRVRPHFHLSVQSGSNQVLRKMARAYSRERIIEVCNNLRLSKENPFIACDIITGFPGETEEDFEDSLLLTKECNFSWVHVFPFSPRPGTPAFSMENQVPESVRTERAKRLSTLASKNKKAYIESCRGKTFEAVLQNVKKPVTVSSGVVFHAVAENFLHAELVIPQEKASSLKQGMCVQIRILDSIPENLSKGGEIDCLAELA